MRTIKKKGRKLCWNEDYAVNVWDKNTFYCLYNNKMYNNKMYREIYEGDNSSLKTKKNWFTTFCIQEEFYFFKVD